MISAQDLDSLLQIMIYYFKSKSWSFFIVSKTEGQHIKKIGTYLRGLHFWPPVRLSAFCLCHTSRRSRKRFLSLENGGNWAVLSSAGLFYLSALCVPALLFWFPCLSVFLLLCLGVADLTLFLLLLGPEPTAALSIPAASSLGPKS